MHVEDHPIEYASFEGTIPPGNYGAGTVMVWDQGTYEDLTGNPASAFVCAELFLKPIVMKLQGGAENLPMASESKEEVSPCSKASFQMASRRRYGLP